MRLVLQLVGAVFVLAGGLWTLQGLGLVMWPAQSFMLAERKWALYGILTAVAGLVLIMMGRRRRR